MCLSLIDKYIYFEERGRKCEWGWYVYFLIIRPREFSTCYWVVVLQWKNGGLRLWIVRGERVLKTCTKEKGKTYITSLEKCTATAVKKQTNTRSTRLQSTWGIVCVFAKPFHFLPQQKIKIKKQRKGSVKTNKNKGQCEFECLVFVRDFLFYFENVTLLLSVNLWLGWLSSPAPIVSTCSPLPSAFSLVFCQRSSEWSVHFSTFSLILYRISLSQSLLF